VDCVSGGGGVSEPWFAEYRLAWIKESVEIFGQINRENIMRKFKISVAQSSHDIKAATQRWPALMAYNSSTKRYEKIGTPKWLPIETAPRDGTEIIVFHKVAGVCAAFCPGEGFAWHCMDGSNIVTGARSGKSIPSMTSFIELPTCWMPLPQSPDVTP
jgi:hypothetical protein